MTTQHSFQTQQTGPDHMGASGMNKSEQQLCTDVMRVLSISKKLMPTTVL